VVALVSIKQQCQRYPPDQSIGEFIKQEQQQAIDSDGNSNALKLESSVALV
jgi:hypothetical protein